MSSGVKAIPDGYEGITLYLICKNASAGSLYEHGTGSLLFRSEKI